MSISPYSRWLIIMFLLMTGCTAPVKVPIIKTPSPAEFKPTTPASITPAVIPSTPTTIRYGPETIPSGPYTPPSVESVTFPPNSGGGMDRETIMSKHGITDAVLKAYEDAAIQEATASGFQAGAVDKNYVDQNELWNMYLRDTTTGSLLWSYRKSDNAMAYQPLMWIIDANGVPQPNPDYELRPIAGSTDSRIVYTPGNYLVEIAKPIVLPDGRVLYSQWRSVLTDELADIPGAAALLPTETPTPEFTATPDMSRFMLSAINPMPESPLQAPMGEKADVATTMAQLHRGPSLLPPDAVPVEVRNIVDRGRGHKVFTMVCNILNRRNCAPAALLKYSKDIVVLILEVKTKSTEQSPDGRGYVAKVIYQPEWPWTGVYDFWRQTPTEHWDMEFTTAIGSQDQQFLPYSYALTQEILQPGFQSATDALVTNGDTSALEAAGIVFP